MNAERLQFVFSWSGFFFCDVFVVHLHSCNGNHYGYKLFVIKSGAVIRLD